MTEAVSVDPRIFRVIVLRHALKLLAVGIKPNRAWTVTRTLRAASEYTGKTYRPVRGACLIAAADLQEYLDGK